MGLAVAGLNDWKGLLKGESEMGNLDKARSGFEELLDNCGDAHTRINELVRCWRGTNMSLGKTIARLEALEQRFPESSPKESALTGVGKPEKLQGLLRMLLDWRDRQVTDNDLIVMFNSIDYIPPEDE